MVDLFHLIATLLLLILSLLILLMRTKILSSQKSKNETKFPKPYPIIGHMIAFYQNKDTIFEWLTRLTIASPTSTFILHRPFGGRNIMTADPALVKHILKTHFPIYQKGPFWKNVLGDLLGDGIFNADGEVWTFQRQISIFEFNTKSLRKFTETVVEDELYTRLIPILSDAAKNNKVLDLQDILQRFAFDNICKISFGYDPKSLSKSLPHSKFAATFEDAVTISTRRFRTFFQIIWKAKRFLNIGSEKRLREAVLEIREFAHSMVKLKKQGISLPNGEESMDLLSRFLKSGHSDEKFLTDVVISFILGGRDTTSSALTWFFWLLHKNRWAEDEILKDTMEKTEFSVFEQVKDMTFTHAALCETMRLYPPIPVDIKEAVANDILPDGTFVTKGTRVTFQPYAMGRLEKLWGPHWAEFRPERWLELDRGEKRWRFVPRDPYTYPVFQAGPRVCIGKEMAFLQMKRVIAGVLERFKVVPVMEDGFEPVFVPNLTAKMQGGLPVRIQERIGKV